MAVSAESNSSATAVELGVMSTASVDYNASTNASTNFSFNSSDYYDYYDDEAAFLATTTAFVLFIVRYVLPVIVLFGTTGNCLCAAVLVLRRRHRGSIDVYRVLLSIADTTVLYVSAFKTWVRSVSGVEWLHASDFACRSLTFALLVALHLSAWLIVLLAVDRFTIVWFPIRAATVCSARAACVAGACVTVVVLAGNIHAFWTFQLNDNWPPRCVPTAGDWFMNVTFNYVKFSTYSFVPFVIVAVLNALIIIRVALLRRRMHARLLTSSSSAATAGCNRALAPPLSAEQVRATSMLVVVVLIWLVFSTPFTLVSVFAVNNIRPQSDSVHLLVKTFAFVLMYVNHSVNVIVYCAMERRFRVALCRMILCYWTTKRPCGCCCTPESRSGRLTGNTVNTTSLLPSGLQPCM